MLMLKWEKNLRTKDSNPQMIVFNSTNLKFKKRGIPICAIQKNLKKLL